MAKQEENRMDEQRFAGLSARISDVRKWLSDDVLRLEERVSRIERRLEERMDRRFAALDERIDRRSRR
jgi:hypothetical protein